ncbi:MAG: hypothetical protein ACTS5V_02215 [Giesbergeria sp.]
MDWRSGGRETWVQSADVSCIPKTIEELPMPSNPQFSSPSAHRRQRRTAGAAMLLALSCCVSVGNVMAAGAAPEAALLVLSATGKQGTFLGKPSCWVSFVVHNNSGQEVTLFSTDLMAVEAGTGKKLNTVSMPGIGIIGNVLATGATSKPWPLNVENATCDKVVVRFSKLLCVAGGRPCAPIGVEQKGVVSIEAPTQ